MAMQRLFVFALLLTGSLTCWSAQANAAPQLIQLAQAQPAPSATPQAAPATPATPAPTASAQAPAGEPVGNVATLTGSATVTRNNATTPLQLRDDIYPDDQVATAPTSSLGLTFTDGTTFNLRANSKLNIDNFVYEDGGKQNNALFDVAKGTAAFVAASVAKTGDMRISTPTATLGIRGTTGLVEIPEGAAATPDNVGIKLYPDADGHVGRIEVHDRSGASLGTLTQGASGFAIRAGTGGARFAAVPLTLSPQQVARDQGFVRQVHAAQTLGRQVVSEQRDFRRANPDFRRNNPSAPYPNRGQPVQPSQQRPNGVPGQQNRPGQPQQPGQPNRPGQPGRQGSQQPGTQQGQHALPGQPGGATLPHAPGAPTPAGQQPVRQGAAPGGAQSPARPGGLQPGRTPSPSGVQQPGAPRQGAASPPVPVPGQMRPQGTQQAAPAIQRPGLQARPGARPLAPRAAKPPPKDKRKR